MLLSQIALRVNSRQLIGLRPIELLTCDSGLAYCHPHRNVDRLERMTGTAGPGPSARAVLPRQKIEGGQNVLHFPQTLSKS